MQLRRLYQTTKAKFGWLLTGLLGVIYLIDNIGRVQTVASLLPMLADFLNRSSVRSILPGLYLVLFTAGLALILWAAREKKQLASEPEGHRRIVLLQFEWTEKRPLGEPIGHVIKNRPFVLLSRDADVFGVQIEPIVCEHGTANFELIPRILKGEQAFVLANIEQCGVLQQHDFERLLLQEWNAGGLEKLTEGITVPARVVYSDGQGRKFRTDHEIIYNPFSGTARTYFRGCSKLEE